MHASVRTDEVAVLEVEAVELAAGLLRIHYILIDHKSRSLGRVGDALAYLAAEKGQSWGFWGLSQSMEAYRIGPNFPKRSNNSSGVTL